MPSPLPGAGVLATATTMNSEIDNQYRAAEQHLERGVAQTADAVGKRLLMAAPSEPHGHILLARSAAATGGAAAGVTSLKAIKEPVRSHPMVLAWLARLSLEAGQEKDAADVVKRYPPDGDPYPAFLWTRARLAVKEGRHKEAANDFVVLTRVIPADRENWRLLATCLMKLGKHAPAVQAIEYVLAQDKRHVETWRMLVDASLQSGNVAKALRVVQDALQAFPRDAELLAFASKLRAMNTATGAELHARITTVQLLLDDEKFTEAQAELAKLKKFFPTSRSVEFLTNEVATVTSGNDQVGALIGPAMRLQAKNPELLEPRLILAGLLLRPTPLKNVKQALELTEGCWAMMPGHPHIGFHLVRTYVAMGRKEQAAALADQLKSLAPQLKERLARITTGG